MFCSLDAEPLLVGLSSPNWGKSNSVKVDQWAKKTPGSCKSLGRIIIDCVVNKLRCVFLNVCYWVNLADVGDWLAFL